MMKNKENYYAKLNGKVIEIVDPLNFKAIAEWQDWFERFNNRRVARDSVGTREVSTVFLGINHGFEGKDLWFETLVIRDEDWSGEYMERYASYSEAVAGHCRIVKALEQGVDLNENHTS